MPHQLLLAATVVAWKGEHKGSSQRLLALHLLAATFAAWTSEHKGLSRRLLALHLACACAAQMELPLNRTWAAG